MKQLDVLEDALTRVDRIGREAGRDADVIVSHFEWVQNRQGYPWTLDEVRERLEAMLVQAFDDMWSVHESEGATLRAAAYTVAMRRISEAIASHGTRAYFQADQR